MLGLNNNKINITVDGGYSPNNFKLKAGKPAEVTFTRVSDKGCTQQVKFNGELYDLPLNQQVTVRFTPQKGNYEWTCGMNMVKGSYRVK